MFIIDLLGWWYSGGWTWIARRLFIENTNLMLDFFSMGDLLKTLFSPFRQDSIEGKNMPFGLKMQAVGNNIISRVFGFFIRSGVIIAGLIVMVSNAFVSTVITLLWPFLPLLPFIAIILFVTGAQ